MRYLSCILSLYILFLTVSPVLLVAKEVNTKTVHCGKSCCSDQAQKKGNEEGNDCCKTLCNPFMVCCNCPALTPQVKPFAVSFVYSERKYCCLNETFSFSYQSDCWHPPKMA